MISQRIDSLSKGVGALLLFAIVSFVSSARSETNEKDAAITRPALHHLLIEVHDMKTSLKFYRDCLGLSLTSQKGDFATLESQNAGIYLWEKHWKWERPYSKTDRNGLGMYPHFNVSNIEAMVARFRTAGYAIIQEPITYDWGIEAFVRDPDGYVIALVTVKEVR